MIAFAALALIVVVAVWAIARRRSFDHSSTAGLPALWELRSKRAEALLSFETPSAAERAIKSLEASGCAAAIKSTPPIGWESFLENWKADSREPLFWVVASKETSSKDAEDSRRIFLQAAESANGNLVVARVVEADSGSDARKANLN